MSMGNQMIAKNIFCNLILVKRGLSPFLFKLKEMNKLKQINWGQTLFEKLTCELIGDRPRLESLPASLFA